MGSNKEENINGIEYKYKITDKRILGKGSFSTVYSGINLNTNEKVAIKKISINKICNEKEIMINNEIEIVKLLINNPNKNIVKYYDIVKTKTHVYIIMEICSCGNLSSLLVKPMKEKYSKYYFSQIINALSYIQELGIVHRDIKPENILLTDNYKTIKICDFGFAKKNDDQYLHSNNIVCGSPIYMAPEILRNEKCSKKTDTWAAGMILYEMIHGYHPCKGIKDLRFIEHTINFIIIMSC